MQIAFHTDAFNSVYWNIQQCARWAEGHGITRMECGVIGGAAWSQALGYYPHLSLQDDPRIVARSLGAFGVELSCLDAAYPLGGLRGATNGVPYVKDAIRWAYLSGCPRVDTTDGLHEVPGMTDTQVLDLMVLCYQDILGVAQEYGITVLVEPHGHYTTQPEFMEALLTRLDSPLLGMTMDTGNVFISGHDPVDFCQRFLHRVRHVHVKDVSESLASMERGLATGIALSPAPIGAGVNAPAIKAVLELLSKAGYDGVLTLESDAAGGPVLERGVAWLTAQLAHLTRTG